jgi:hypothetical protein
VVNFVNPRRQRGVTALVALVFLLLLAFLGLSAYRIAGQQTALVGNQQSRAQSLAAANYAIEQMLNSASFASTPALWDNAKVDVDINGDGKIDAAADIAVRTRLPQCLRVRVVKTSELSITNAADRGCFGSTGGAGGNLVVGGGGAAPIGGGGDSACADTDWDLRAEVNDTATGTSVAVNQGVAMRVDAADASNFCK